MSEPIRKVVVTPKHLATASHEEKAYLKSLYFKKLAEKKGKKSFDLKKHCEVPNGQFFHKQYEFVTDPSRFKTLDKSRRAGGTMGLAGLFMAIGDSQSNVNMAYITLDRGTAERIIWHELIKLNDIYQLGIAFNQQKLWVQYPNGSMLYMAGAKDRHEINKMRGKAFSLVALDECQSFRDSIMKELINDVLEASLIDTAGRLILCGTPNAACAGYFYEACLSPGYQHFHWTMDDNPWLPYKSGLSIKDIRQAHLERKGITESDTSYQREWCGKWIKDEHSLVFRFDRQRNTYEELPDNQRWMYILSADIGWHDADAICIWAFSEDLPDIYLVSCEASSHQSISDFADRVKILEEKYGSFVSRVIDTGGLGLKITEELKSRHGIYFKPAEKTRKHEYIKLMNADFVAGHIKVRKNLAITEDLERNQWDVSKDPPIEDERFANDETDAALYGYRESKHYGWSKALPKTLPYSKKHADEIWEGLAKQDQKRNEEQWWESL